MSPALSHSSATGFLASLAAWAAILAVCFASGASLLAGLTAPPASGSWFTVVAPRERAGRGRLEGGVGDASRSTTRAPRPGPGGTSVPQPDCRCGRTTERPPWGASAMMGWPTPDADRRDARDAQPSHQPGALARRVRRAVGRGNAADRGGVRFGAALGAPGVAAVRDGVLHRGRNAHRAGRARRGASRRCAGRARGRLRPRAPGGAERRADRSRQSPRVPGGARPPGRQGPGRARFHRPPAGRSRRPQEDQRGPGTRWGRRAPAGHGTDHPWQPAPVGSRVPDRRGRVRGPAVGLRAGRGGRHRAAHPGGCAERRLRDARRRPVLADHRGVCDARAGDETASSSSTRRAPRSTGGSATAGRTSSCSIPPGTASRTMDGPCPSWPPP